jgi:hypothetical protein
LNGFVDIPDPGFEMSDTLNPFPEMVYVLPSLVASASPIAPLAIETV